MTGQVTVNGQRATVGISVNQDDIVKLDGTEVLPKEHATILLNKPVGYVCSRDGQGSQTVYDLLPKKFHHLKPIGRLDKNSSGLLLLTNDGKLADALSHPRYQKEKIYEVKLDKPLRADHKKKLERGVSLEDGVSRFAKLVQFSDSEFRVSLYEGKNRQIRRTFEALGYQVTRLKRTQFGPFSLGGLPGGEWRSIDSAYDSTDGCH